MKMNPDNVSGVCLSEPLPIVTPEIPSIQTEAQVVLTRVQQTLSKLITRIPGGIKRPMDLQHALGEDYKVCWQVFQFVQAENPVAVSHHIPSAVLMRKFIAAAEARGVPAEIVGRAQEAMQDFNAMVAAHSDDRAAFDAMLATISGGAMEAMTVQHRRKAFRTESLLWGVQTGVLLSQFFVKVSDDGQWQEVCYVVYKHELRRLRPNVMPLLHGFKPQAAETSNGQTRRVALEPESMEAYGAPLMPAFCSQPAPRLLSVPAADGWVYAVLDSKELGRKGSATVAFSGISRALLARDLPNGLLNIVNTQITMPTELYLMEFFMHRPSFVPGVPTFQSRLMAPGLGPGADHLPEILQQACKLELHEKLESLGTANEITPLTKIPNYERMLEHVFTQLKWDKSEFDAYRLEIQYPMLHSEMELRAQLSPEIRIPAI